MATVLELKQAGFNEDEIRAHLEPERQRLSDAGFSSQEINSHFGTDDIEPIEVFNSASVITFELLNDPNSIPENYMDANTEAVFSEGLGVAENAAKGRKRLTENMMIAASAGVGIDTAELTHDEMERAGFLETLKEEWTIPERVISKIPFIGALVPFVEYIKIGDAAKRLNSGFDYTKAVSKAPPADPELGEIMSPSVHRPFFHNRSSDIKLIEDYIDRVTQDRTFMGKVAAGVSILPTWMIEFAMTGGVAFMGKEATKKGAIRLLGNYAKTKVGRTALRAAGWTGGAITRTTLGLPDRVVGKAAERQLQAKVGLQEQEGWASSFALAWGDIVIESASEEAGQAITGFGGAILRKTKLGSKIANGLQKAWTSLTGGSASKFNQLLAKGGYSNILGEIGEERLGTILRAITDVEDFGTGPDSTVMERLAAGLQQDIANLPVEAVVLSLPLAGQSVINKIGKGFARAPLEDVAAEAQEATGEAERGERADRIEEQIGIKLIPGVARTVFDEKKTVAERRRVIRDKVQEGLITRPEGLRGEEVLDVIETEGVTQREKQPFEMTKEEFRQFKETGIAPPAIEGKKEIAVVSEESQDLVDRVEQVHGPDSEVTQAAEELRDFFSPVDPSESVGERFEEIKNSKEGKKFIKGMITTINRRFPSFTANEVRSFVDENIDSVIADGFVEQMKRLRSAAEGQRDVAFFTEKAQEKGSTVAAQLLFGPNSGSFQALRTTIDNFRLKGIKRPPTTPATLARFSESAQQRFKEAGTKTVSIPEFKTDRGTLEPVSITVQEGNIGIQPSAFTAGEKESEIFSKDIAEGRALPGRITKLKKQTPQMTTLLDLSLFVGKPLDLRNILTAEQLRQHNEIIEEANRQGLRPWSLLAKEIPDFDQIYSESWEKLHEFMSRKSIEAWKAAGIEIDRTPKWPSFDNAKAWLLANPQQKSKRPLDISGTIPSEKWDTVLNETEKHELWRNRLSVDFNNETKEINLIPTAAEAKKNIGEIAYGDAIENNKSVRITESLLPNRCSRRFDVTIYTATNDTPGTIEHAKGHIRFEVIRLTDPKTFKAIRAWHKNQTDSGLTDPTQDIDEAFAHAMRQEYEGYDSGMDESLVKKIYEVDVTNISLDTFDQLADGWFEEKHEIGLPEPTEAENQADAEHKRLVQQAVREGQDVPIRVLEEFKNEKWAARAITRAELGIKIKPPKPPAPAELPLSQPSKAEKQVIDAKKFLKQMAEHEAQVKGEEGIVEIETEGVDDVEEPLGRTMTDQWYEANTEKYKKTIIEKASDAAKRMVKGIDKVLGSTSTRLNNISPELFRRTRRHVFNVMTRTTEQVKRVDPFIKLTKKLDKKTLRQLDLAFKNSDGTKIRQIAAENNMTAEMNEVRGVLNQLYNEGNAVGLEIDYRKNYMPRVVKDTKGFLEFFQKGDDWSIIRNVIENKESQRGRALTESERAAAVNTLLRGYRTSALTLTAPGAAKARTVQEIDAELNQFYHDFRTSLTSYIRVMNEKISSREFFGRQSKEITKLRARQSTLRTRLAKLSTRQGRQKAADADKEIRIGFTTGTLSDHISIAQKQFEEVTEKLDRMGADDLSNSVGNYVIELVTSEQIKPSQEKEIRDLLMGIFDPMGTHGLVGDIIALTYIDVLSSPLNAITQIEELGLSFYRSPLGFISEAVKATLNLSEITTQDIGVTSVGQEFFDADFKKALSFIMGVTGFEKIDRTGKQTFINTVIKKMRKQARRPDKAFMARLNRVFGTETSQVIEDLKSGRMTDNIKYLAFNQLLDIQPVAITEMPEAYNRAGNMRILFTLKTFMIKQLDFVRTEALQDMKSTETFMQGFGKLVWLSFSLALFGAGADWIKDFIRGRPFDIRDSVIDTFLRRIFFSKFQFEKAMSEGFGRAFLQGFVPPTKVIDALSKDIKNVWKDPGKAGQIARSVPIVGELYYWWFGLGREKAEKEQRRARRQKARRKPLFTGTKGG